MENEERLKLIGILKKTVKALETRDSYSARQQSDTATFLASLHQDENSISVAVMIYALSKIMEHGNINLKKTSSYIEKAISHLEANNHIDFRTQMKEIISDIEKQAPQMDRFIKTVMESSQIKKSCSICQNGISAARAANIMGISQWELMNYIKQISPNNDYSENVSIRDRIRLSRRLFN